MKSLLHISFLRFVANNIALPHYCVFCQQTCRYYDCCQACAADLACLPAHCQYCANPLPGVVEQSAICGACLSHKKPAYQQVYIPYIYQAPLANLIQGLKFHQQLVYAEILGQLLARYLKVKYQDQVMPQVILPVPLHRKRLRQRGYNQALEIGRSVAKCLQLPVKLNYLHRHKATLAQADLSQQARRENVRQAFSLSRACEFKHVALLDDVFTTGHTVAECAKVLQQSGVERIDVWCPAKTIKAGVC